MPNRRIEAEELAALLDGALTSAERERALSNLSYTEESYEDLLETVALLNAVESAPQASAEPQSVASPAPKQTAGFSRSAARWRSPGKIGIATLLAASLVVALVMRPSSSTVSEGELLAAISLAGSPTATGDASAAYGPRWNEPAWAESRGLATGESVEKNLFRAGVRFSEFQVALTANDSTAVRSTAMMLRASIAELDGGALIGATIDRVIASRGQGGGTLINQLRALGESSVWFDLGLWSEAARLAAASGQVIFFSAEGEPIGVLRRIIDGSKGLTAETQAQLVPILGALRPIAELEVGTGTDISAVRTHLDSALAAGAR